jgi:hypothetical protein
MAGSDSPTEDATGYDTTGDVENDPRVSTVPLTTDDGDEVVISQQNVGPGNQVGRGEFETNGPAAHHRTAAEAADEQDRLDRELDQEESR